MMRPLFQSLWLILAVLSQVTYAKRPAKECATAVSAALSDVIFDGVNTADDYYTGLCTNKLRGISMYEAMRQHCTSKEISAGIDYFKEACAYGMLEPLPWNIIDNVTDETIKSWPTLTFADMTNTANLSTPALISPDLWTLALKTVQFSNDQDWYEHQYGWSMFIFFAIVFAIALVSRAVNFISARRWNAAITSTAPSKPSKWRSIRLATKRYITTPALFGKRCAEPWGWAVVPPRLESLTIITFIAINIATCAANYPVLKQSLYYTITSLQFWVAFADRTGVISTYNVPLLWIFATRNNVLLWMTGWSFATFNSFHRWVARVATLEAILHSIAFTVYMVIQGGKAQFIEVWSYKYWWMGTIATISMSFLWATSFLPIRKHAYEFFLISHVILAILALYGLWFHLKIIDPELLNFLYPCFAVWGFDRLLRIGKLVYLNRSFKATASYNDSADILRLTVPVSKWVKPQPGTYYFVYFLGDFQPWENHPFTLSTWEDNEGSKSLSFILRPMKGATNRLKNRVVKRQDVVSNAAVPIRVVIEGPYGSGHSFEKYNSVLFIIGGSGITVALAHLKSLIDSLSSQQNSSIRQLHLVWAVRDEGLYQDVFKNELEAWVATASSHSVDLVIDIHVTGEETTTTAVSKQVNTPETMSNGSSGDITPASNKAVEAGIDTVKALDSDVEKRSQSTRLSENLSILRHRPNVEDIVLNSARDWCVRGERLAVVSCGPVALIDRARAASVKAYSEGYDSLDFVPESFTW